MYEDTQTLTKMQGGEYRIIKINFNSKPVVVGSVDTLQEAFDVIKDDPLLFVQESDISVRIYGCSYAHLMNCEEAVAV